MLNKNLFEACFCFYWLGQKAEFLAHWQDNADFSEYMKAQWSNQAKREGLRTKALKQQALKKLCQDQARTIWNLDKERQLRTKNVAQSVWEF